MHYFVSKLLFHYIQWWIIYKGVTCFFESGLDRKKMVLLYLAYSSFNWICSHIFMSLDTAMLWIGSGDLEGDFSAPNSSHSLMQNLSPVHILALALSTNIKRKTLWRPEAIPQKPETTCLPPSQPAPTGHVYPVTASVSGRLQSTCFWGTPQTWAVEHHHNAVAGDSHSVEQINVVLRLSGERDSDRQIILGLIKSTSVSTLWFSLWVWSHFIFCFHYVFFWELAFFWDRLYYSVR